MKPIISWPSLSQSTLPMRGATIPKNPGVTQNRISIHAPHAGSDWAGIGIYFGLAISIHAPHAGSDGQKMVILPHATDFNPRSPCGERLGRPRFLVQVAIFQSTLPMRGATGLNPHPRSPLKFQSTLPMRGATSDSSSGAVSQQFQSTLPMRGATLKVISVSPVAFNFNPRSPCGERRWTWME